MASLHRSTILKSFLVGLSTGAIMSWLPLLRENGFLIYALLGLGLGWYSASANHKWSSVLLSSWAGFFCAVTTQGYTNRMRLNWGLIENASTLTLFLALFSGAAFALAFKLTRRISRSAKLNNVKPSRAI